MPACMQDLLSTARIPPAVEQIEGHAYLRNDYVIAWCKSQVLTTPPLGYVAPKRLPSHCTLFGSTSHQASYDKGCIAAVLCRSVSYYW